MRVKEFIRALEGASEHGLVMVATVDENGDTQMVEAEITIDVRTGDVEVLPANK